MPAASGRCRPTLGEVTDQPARPLGFVHVRIWLALFVVSCAFELVTGLVLNQWMGWPPSLLGPALFASTWTGLGIAQNRYNAPRPK